MPEIYPLRRRLRFIGLTLGMADVVVRPVQPEDEAGFRLVMSLTYQNGEPVDLESAPNAYADRFAAILDGQVVGGFAVLPFTSTRGEALLKCGAVAAVGVLPEIRRAGVGKAMMDWLPGHLRTQGVELASLYPFRETFYAKSGYASVGKRIRVSAPTHRIPKIDSELPVRRLTPEDWELLRTCHTAFAHARSGVHVRSELMWKRVLNEHKALTIYAVGEPVEGYIAVSHDVSFFVEQSLSEVVWSTPRGYEALLGVMRQLGINKTSLGWFEPSDSPYMAHYLDQGISTKIERTIMFRVCDVPAALGALKTDQTGSFRISIEDPQVIENEGPWEVNFSPAGVTVLPTNTADFTLSIHKFSQAFMGEPSFADLRRIGAIDSENRDAMDAAQRLLPALPVVCGDFF